MLGSGYTSIEPNSWIQNCQNDGMPYKTGQLSFNGILLEPRTDIVLHRPQELCIQRLHSATVWLIYRLTGQVCTVKMLPAMGVRHGLRTSNSFHHTQLCRQLDLRSTTKKNQLPEPHLIATNPLKDLELWEQQEEKPDLPEISQQWQLT